MPRPYAVTPQLRGRKTYSATFYVASGKKVVGSLLTQNESDAKLRAEGLVALRACMPASLDDPRIPATVSLESRQIYFEIESEASGKDVLADVVRESRQKLKTAVAGNDIEAMRAIAQRDQFRRALELKEEENNQLKRDLLDEKRKHTALKSSAVAQLAEARESLPTVAEALALYEKSQAGISRVTKQTRMRIAKAFAASLPASIRTLAEVRPEHLAKWMDDEVARIDSKQPLTCRRGVHIELASFINWGARTFDYPSQIKKIPFPERAQRKRERGEIHWHKLNEIEAVIKGLKFEDKDETIYWQTLIAVMAYAGPQLAELCWLRNTDVTVTEKSGSVWIGPVTDPTDPTVVHALKEGDRERHVNVDKKYLLPRLRKYVQAGLRGEAYFFPVRVVRRERARVVNRGHPERWIEDTLSTRMRGHAGGTDKEKRPPTAGILPKGMNAKSLRRTFGSLLLRSGKNYAEVAAAMGNTEQVVREHYARLKAGEVEIDFNSTAK